MRFYSRRELLAQGSSDFDISSQIKAGRLQRVAPGIYVEDPVSDRAEFHRELALWLPLPDGMAWAQGTAAVLHRLPVPSPPGLLIAVGQGDGRSHLRALVKRSTARLAECDLTTMQGVRLTTLARTVVDVARTSAFATGVVVADAALRQAAGAGRAQDLARELREVIDRVAGMRGSRRAQLALAASRLGAESPMETRSRLLLRSMGFPEPTLQYEVRDAAGNLLGRADMAWPEAGVLGEYDGRGKYLELRREGQTADDVVLAERRRQLALEDAGWVVVRWGKEELAQPALLRARVAAAFERARRLRAA